MKKVRNDLSSSNEVFYAGEPQKWTILFVHNKYLNKNGTQTQIGPLSWCSGSMFRERFSRGHWLFVKVNCTWNAFRLFGRELLISVWLLRNRVEMMGMLRPTLCHDFTLLEMFQASFHQTCRIKRHLKVSIRQNAWISLIIHNRWSGKFKCDRALKSPE